MEIGNASTVVLSPNASKPQGKRKPKGWTHRYQLILQPTDLGRGASSQSLAQDQTLRQKYRRDADSLVPMFRPLGNVSDEQLVIRAGIEDVTVPVEIIRPRAEVKT